MKSDCNTKFWFSFPSKLQDCCIYFPSLHLPPQISQSAGDGVVSNSIKLYLLRYIISLLRLGKNGTEALRLITLFSVFLWWTIAWYKQQLYICKYGFVRWGLTMFYIKNAVTQDSLSISATYLFLIHHILHSNPLTNFRTQVFHTQDISSIFWNREKQVDWNY